MHASNSFVAVLFLNLFPLLFAQTAVGAPPPCVAVVGTNDLHGAIVPYQIAINPTHADPTTATMGGILGLSAYVKLLKQSYGERMVLVDGGDLFQGTMASNLSQGRAVIDGYNLLGYWASAIGNHEFDFGALPGNPDRISVLKARIAEARFPFLALNVFDKVTGQRISWPNTKPSIIKDAGGIKVGILGISTVDTPMVTNPENVTTLSFRDPVPLIVSEAAALRQQGAQLVILIGHVGGKCAETNNPDDAGSCSTGGRDGELFAILRALPKGTLDVAVGGHTHQFIAHWVNGVATIESGAKGHYLGWIDACIAPTGGISRATSTIHPPTPLCLTTFASGKCLQHPGAQPPVRPAQFLGQQPTVMPDMEQAMKPYLEAVAVQEAQPIGATLAKPLGYGSLATLVAEAMRRATRGDFGLQNTGGIRADLRAGKITFGQVFAVLPFDNSIARIQMTGAQVEQLVRHLLDRHHSVMAPRLSGLRISRNNGRIAVVNSKGMPLDPQRTYVLSTSDFIAQGGEGTAPIWDSLGPDRMQMTTISTRDAFQKLLVALYPDP